MNKVFATAAEAIHDLTDGATLLVGGFGLSGNPECLIRAVHAKGVRDLALVSNNAGTDGRGLGVLLEARQVRTMTGSYVGEKTQARSSPLSASSALRSAMTRLRARFFFSFSANSLRSLSTMDFINNSIEAISFWSCKATVR